jgi:lipopolysaccharide export system protein LptA
MNWIKTMVCGMLLSSSAAWGLESDSEQPIYIDSNSATYDEKAQTSIYSGNVVATQGSLRIDAAQLVVHINGGNITKLVASGSPARFKQQPAPGKDDIRGEALVGEFYPEQSQLVLMKNAVVWQGDNKATSDLIRYDSKNSLIKAGGGASAGGTSGQRVHSVIQPSKKGG